MADDRDLLKAVATALRGVTHPETGRDIIAAGVVRGLTASGSGEVRFKLKVEADNPLIDAARVAAESVAGVVTASVEVEQTAQQRPNSRRKLPVVGPEAGGGPQDAPPGPPPSRPVPAPPKPQTIPGVRRVVAISSGKGGVGKSTVATNIAAALASRGYAVGLLDADVYGPNIPIMFGAYGRPQVTREERVVPLEAHGVKLISVGFLLDEETPAIWRGPIVMGIIRQFLQQVDWGKLDYLFVDMPPGTGDAQLSLVQLVKVDGAVLVTTPQGVATADVLKGIKMFERVDVPVLGVIENMSGFACPHCGEKTDLFGRGGGRKLAAIAGVPFLGEVPLGAAVVGNSDRGEPTVLTAADSPEGRALIDLAEKVAASLADVDRASQSASS